MRLFLGAAGEWGDGSDQRLWLGGKRKDGLLIGESWNGADRKQSARRERGQEKWERGEGRGGLCKRGRAESERGGQGGGGREPREEVKAEEEEGIHGNKPGLREIRLSEGEFVCNNNTNYSLSLRSLGRVGGRNGELKCEKLEG